CERAYDPAHKGWGEQRILGVVVTSSGAAGLRDAPLVERWRRPSHQRTCQTATAESLVRLAVHGLGIPCPEGIGRGQVSQLLLSPLQATFSLPAGSNLVAIW